MTYIDKYKFFFNNFLFKNSLFIRSNYVLSYYSLIGTNNEVNQDYYKYIQNYFFGVSDGVGGGAYGEIASNLLLESMATLMQPTACEINNQLLKVDFEINSKIKSLGPNPGAAVMACIWAGKDGRIVSAHVGDCKIFHLRLIDRKWKIIWSSDDQTYTFMGVDPPVGISPLAPANMVGCGMSGPASINEVDFKINDRLILCSDGFSSLKDHPEISFLIENSSFPLEFDFAKILSTSARSNGSNDDITLIVLERNYKHSITSFFIVFIISYIFFFNIL